MSSIVTSILSSTVGLLWNKARDSIAAKLKDGDVTDAKIREVVVREINDIKTQLDGLSRKDLLSSYSFLQEGVDFLNVSLNKSKLEQKALVDETQHVRGETSTMQESGVESGIVNEALELSHAIGKLRIYSEEELESAKKRFEEARKTATHAFCNEALSVKDRIFAAKVRIVSEILECLDRPETATTGCLSFLKKLHSLPAIQEIFTVYLKKGGVKSILNKAERVENVKSIMLINYELFQYVSRFSTGNYGSAYAWPTIEFADRRFHPILDWQEVSTRKSMRKKLPTQQPNVLFLHEKIRPRCLAINSRWDVVIAYAGGIKVISKGGESMVVKIPEPSNTEVIEQYIVRLAVDNNNNIYVVKWLKTRGKNGDMKSCVLYVLDESYNPKQERILNFVEKNDLNPVRIAINKNNNITMIMDNDPHVYVCDNVGKLIHKFERDSRRLTNLIISGQNEVMTSSDDLKAVHIYSEEGNMKMTIQLPEDHGIRGLAFHYVICKIIVLAFVEKKDSYFLLCYTKEGELETSTFFSKINGRHFPKIKSHPNGPVAIVSKQSITFI